MPADKDKSLKPSMKGHLHMHNVSGHAVLCLSVLCGERGDAWAHVERHSKCVMPCCCCPVGLPCCIHVLEHTHTRMWLALLYLTHTCTLTLALMCTSHMSVHTTLNPAVLNTRTQCTFSQGPLCPPNLDGQCCLLLGHHLQPQHHTGVVSQVCMQLHTGATQYCSLDV